MSAIITAILALLPSVLQAAGVNPNLDSLITSLGTALTGLITSLVSKQPVESTVLSTLQATMVALEADTSLDPTVLADISEGLSMLKSAIAAFQSAEVTTDPSTLTPLPEL